MVVAGMGTGSDWQSAGQAATTSNPPNLAPPSPAQATLNKAQNPDRESIQPTGPGAPPDVHGQVPLVLKPARTGIAGVMDKVADALAGATRPDIYHDDQGNAYVYHPNLTRGQQWRRIAAEAVEGASRGLAAGKGAGNMGRAGVAGVEAGEAHAQERENQEKEMTAEANKEMMNNANNQLLRMQIAEQAWRASRLKTEATQHDIEFAQKQVDRYEAAGGKILGTAAHPGDIAGIVGVNPTLMEDLVQRHTIEIVPTLTADGHQGLTVIKMPDQYRNKLLPPGAVFHTFDPINGQIVPHNASDAMTQGEIDDLDTKAHTDSLKFKNDQTEDQLKQSEIQAHKATASEAPSLIQEHEASAAKSRAEANKANAEAKALQSGGLGPMAPGANPISTGDARADQLLSSWPLAVQQSVLGLAQYDIKPEAFPPRKYAKGNEMDRETAEGLARMITPGWDEKTWGARNKAKTEWADPQKAGGTIISLNQGIQHLGELSESVDELHNSNFWLWNAGQNLFRKATSNPILKRLQTAKTGVDGELASIFKKTSGTDQEITKWDENFDAADGHRAQRASIDEALKLLVGRINALHGQYRAAMGADPEAPFLNDQAANTLLKFGPSGQALVALDRRQTRGGSAPAPQQQQPTRPRPPGATGTAMGPDNKLHWTNEKGQDFGAAN